VLTIIYQDVFRKLRQVLYPWKYSPLVTITRLMLFKVRKCSVMHMGKGNKRFN